MARGLGTSVAGGLLLASVLGACGSDDGGPPVASAERGKEVFTRAACSACHTLADIRAAGTSGPNLDEIKPNALKVAQTVRNGSGQMPSFDGTLTDEEIEAVALYVQEATGAEPIEE